MKRQRKIFPKFQQHIFLSLLSGKDTIHIVVHSNLCEPLFLNLLFLKLSCTSGIPHITGQMFCSLIVSKKTACNYFPCSFISHLLIFVMRDTEQSCCFLLVILFCFKSQLPSLTFQAEVSLVSAHPKFFCNCNLPPLVVPY